jgi:formylglycine-generating enzyme required for sulfatase activity
MKSLKVSFYLLSICALATSASGVINIDTVLVGDAGNANDSTGYGGVSYDYHVGTYEVTNSQYVSFLNATGASNTHGVFNASMESDSRGGIQQDGGSGSFSYNVKAGFGDKPVNFVSFWDAARFTNWLTSGDTEVGVYNLGGVTSPTNADITRDAKAWAAGGVAIASEDEWYKAAYYKGGSTTAGYWDYAHQSDSITTADANYANSVGTLTDVGTYSDDASYYGTFDQGGNVWEWNDAIVSSSDRGRRGGAFNSHGYGLQPSDRVNFLIPTDERDSVGFRVSSLAPIPEPSTYAAIFGGLALSVATMRRKGRRTL